MQKGKNSILSTFYCAVLLLTQKRLSAGSDKRFNYIRYPVLGQIRKVQQKMLIKQCFSLSSEAFKIKPEVSCCLITQLVGLATALLTEIALRFLLPWLSQKPSPRMVLEINHPFEFYAIPVMSTREFKTDVINFL